MQGDRYSIAYFANARLSTIVQGPLRKYPPITPAQVSHDHSRMQLRIGCLMLSSQDGSIAWGAQVIIHVHDSRPNTSDHEMVLKRLHADYGPNCHLLLTPAVANLC